MALAPSHGTSLDDLVRHADAAMRAVKAAGRANFRLHQLRTEVDRREHMRLDHSMRQALVSNRFRLHYQPQVRLADGCIVGAEALLRWRDPELGEMSPARFIPVAEDSGFVVAIGDWVLTQAVRQAALWHQRGHALPIAVNVSALQFKQSNFVDRVASVLAVSGVPPHLLELELTESILVQDADEALQRLHALSALGVRLSIDDFGTGYSSLAYLKRFPIGKLKIDRSFVAGLPGDESDAGIVRAILQMARALDKKVIAEGVETEAQRSFLVAAGAGKPELRGASGPCCRTPRCHARAGGAALQARARLSIVRAQTRATVSPQASQWRLLEIRRHWRDATAMIYKFKSKASGDVIMLGPNGDQLLSLLGREPAPQGIIEVAAMPAALVALQAAIDAEAARESEAGDAADGDEAPGARAIALRQRLWPMMDMLRRAQAAGVPVVWGV